MNVRMSGISVILSVLAIGSVSLVRPTEAVGDQYCAGTSPRVCVKKSGAVEPLTHFVFSFSDPDNPDIQLITGATDWEVWSQVSEMNTDPANIGAITTPGDGDDDFVVTIANGANPGAADVESMFLAPSGNHYTSIGAGSAITGDLGGWLYLKSTSGGTGGVISGLTIDGNVDYEIQLRKINGDGLTIGGDVGFNVTVDEVRGDGLTIAGTYGGDASPYAFMTIDDVVDSAVM